MGSEGSTIWERRGAYRVLVGKLDEETLLGRLGRRWEMILIWVFKKWDGAWIALIWLRIRMDGRLL
jgi:hypothetical protein